MAETKEILQKDMETKQIELATLKAKILAETEKETKKTLEENKKKLEEEIVVLQTQLDDLEKIEKNTAVSTIKKETDQLKDGIEVDSDWSYELMKGSKMHEKLLTVLGTEDKVEAFALEIDKVVRKFLDQELK